MKRFYLGAKPLGEGMVVASSFDGRMFKLKHGGEECGKVPDRVSELIDILIKANDEKDNELIALLESLFAVLKAGRGMKFEEKKPEKKKTAPKQQAVDE
jgi:hypothetical protein